MKKLGIVLAWLTTSLIFVSPAAAAGTLTPVGSPHQPIQIRDHHLDVEIVAGFARSEVLQTFYNPNDQDLEAVYSFPVPKSGSLSEYSIWAGETRIDGEVVSKKKANEIYEEEKKQGNDAGVANKNSYQTFEFKIAKIPAKTETKMRFVYYQPLQIDTGIGRYVYPLEDGGTDDVAKSFWVPNTKVENTFSASLKVLTAYPIEDLRLPGYEAAAKILKKGEGEFEVTLSEQAGSLNKDLVLYYRLTENHPAGIELIPYRADPSKPGTFMLITTPGIDLKPLADGADYIFVLDVSGSMQGKIQTLARGVEKALGELKPVDRFRVITFNERAQEISSGWLSGSQWIPASEQNVRNAISQVSALQANGSTNIYEGLEQAFNGLDNDRVTSIVLVTDGVTNTGILEPKEFAALVKKHDVRLFGFLMGNSSNWPLMEVITTESGGFYAAVSNADDIVGQIMLAKSKIRFESLHNAELKISGIKVHDTTESTLGKVYRGEQVVIFGRYEGTGDATVTLQAALSGEDKVYKTTVNFPATATEHPELERLWAMNQVEAIQHRQQLGELEQGESSKAIEDIGVAYQLVTDETSMLVLSDAGFMKHGIDRNNRNRVVVEDQARSQRAAQPAINYRQQSQPPMFPSRRPTLGGGGVIDPLTFALLGASLGALGLRNRKRN